MIKIKKILAVLFVFSLFLTAKPVFAHCPLCVAATGSAVAAARFYGVPDLITGTFVGAFIISIAFWTNRLLKKKNRGKNYIPFQPAVITALSLTLTLITFHLAGLASISTVFGIDIIFMGILVGSFVTLVAFGFNDFLRKSNGNKNYIPFQVIVLTLMFLFITTFAYYGIGLV